MVLLLALEDATEPAKGLGSLADPGVTEAGWKDCHDFGLFTTD